MDIFIIKNFITMKKLLIILLTFISINAYSQCAGISATGTTKNKTFKSCYDTVVVKSTLNTVAADTLTATLFNGIALSGSSSPSIAVTGTTTISGTHSGTSSGTNTGDQTISINGDVTAPGSTGVLSATVTKINNTSLSGLPTGILKNTTGTGVPSIAAAGTDYVIPSGSITGTSNTIVSSPDYFYTGSTFYKSRVGISFMSPFYNNSGATNAPTNLVFIGDSRLESAPLPLLDLIGQYNKINSLGFVHFYSNIYGTPAISFVNSGTAATLTRNDSTTSANWGIAGSRADAASGAVFTITPATKYRFDAFNLWYNRTSGGGSFTYSIDGGGAVTVNTSAVSDSLGTLTVSTGLGNSSTHTIVLTVTSGSVRFYGIDFYNKAQTGYSVHILQSGNSKASQWSGAATNLYTKQFIAAKDPKLCIIWLGTNDAGSGGTGASSTTYITNLKNLIKNINLPSKCSPVIITETFRGKLASPTVADTAANIKLADYRTKIIQAVTDSGYSAFDMQNYWPSFTYAVANSMLADAIHPTFASATYMWAGLIRAVLPVSYNEAMSGAINFRKSSVLVPNDGVTGFGSIQLPSNGIQTEHFTGWYFPFTGFMDYKSGNVKYMSFTTGNIIMTAYPTSSFPNVLTSYRQGSTSNKAFDLTVNSDVSTSLTTNNAPFNITATSFRVSSKIYSGGIATTPTALLHLGAGTATASTAPLKFTSGTNLTTAEAGVIEYNNSFYQTKNSALRYGLGGTIFDAFADAGNSTTTETDLHTYTTPANTLEANGAKISSNYAGTFVSSATATRQMKVYFGGTAIFDSGTLTISASAAWDVKVNIIRVSSTVVRYTVCMNTQNAALAAYTAVGELTGLTLSNTNIIKITGQAAGVGAATNDIVLKLATGEWKPVSAN